MHPITRRGDPCGRPANHDAHTIRGRGQAPRLRDASDGANPSWSPDTPQKPGMACDNLRNVIDFACLPYSDAVGMEQSGLPRRRSPRLQDYDYSSAGAYFVTICAHEHMHLFGEVAEGLMVLSLAGAIAQDQWFVLPRRFPLVQLDEFVVMPNHVHGILVMTEPDSQSASTHSKPTVSQVIGAYKSLVVKCVWGDPRLSWNRNMPIWQRSFHDHIIRDDRDLAMIRGYIAGNALKWSYDRYYSG